MRALYALFTKDFRGSRKSIPPPNHAANQEAGNIMFHANTNLLIHDHTIVETGVMGGKGGYDQFVLVANTVIDTQGIDKVHSLVPL